MFKTDYRKDFASFEGKIWLNAASEGPLPLVAGKALAKAVEWKQKPYLLDTSKFVMASSDLKGSIGRLMATNQGDVILGNSASYGLHILANGILWREGDEILLMENDFPTNILPWLALEKKGVVVRQIKPKGNVLEPEEVLTHLNPETRLLCLSHVHTFTGIMLDVQEFGRICRKNNIIFVLNLSQSLGTMPCNIARYDTDAVVCAGYKWLCGPYGTGFCWIKPSLRDQLELNQAYWVSMLSRKELQGQGPLRLKETKDARRFDVFGTADFFDHVPLRAAIDYWLDAGLEGVRAYHDRLIDHLIAGLKGLGYILISPEQGNRRSSLVVFSHTDRNKNTQIHEGLLARGIYPALWKGNIRISPHAYNTKDEIDQVIKALKEMSS